MRHSRAGACDRGVARWMSSSDRPRVRAGVARCLIVTLAVGWLAAGVALGQLNVPVRNDALCRQDLHKRSASLALDTLNQLSQCHNRRVADRIAPAIDCNDSDNAMSPERIERAVEKLHARARLACAARPDTQPPSGLGYIDCPAPCADVPIAEDYDSGVATCLACVMRAETEALLAQSVGLPAVPLDQLTARCHTRLVSGTVKYLGLQMGVQRRCQSLVDLGRLAPSVDCVTFDPTGRLASARARVAQIVAKCAGADLNGLDACSDTLVGISACIADRSAQAAAVVFAAVYRPVPATPTPTGTPTATPTVTPTPFGAELDIGVAGSANTALDAVLSGTRLSGPAAAGRAVSYGPVALPVAAAGSEVLNVPGLAPGIWLHQVSVGATDQLQFLQSLVVDDPLQANRIDWQLFDHVWTVNDPGDAGDVVCDATCTLRDAAASANAAPGRSLVRFVPALPEIEITQLAGIFWTAAGTMVDGTDSAGDPSPVLGFAGRSFPVRIALIAPNIGPIPADCPCNEGDAGVLRVQAAGVELRGLAIRRQHVAEGSICCGDQDLVAFDGGTSGARLDTLRLDGGAAAITSAEVPGSATRPPTGKDCVDAEATGADAIDPVVVRNSEVRFCYDRGIKSKAGVLRVERSWVHHNLRGGLFAQSPGVGTTLGVVVAADNLVEANGLNCPSGDPTACGVAQVVARAGASEISAQGEYTRIETDGNVIRNGVLQGIFVQSSAEAAIRRDYVCGINRGSGGKGILIKKITGDESQVTVRESAFVYNDDAGAKLDDAISADFGLDGGSDAGRNAFAENGAIPRRNFINVLAPPVPLVPARGNQWENCYAGPPPNPDACAVQALSDADTNNNVGDIDRVDVAAPLAHANTSPMSVTAIRPQKQVQDGMVRIVGSGFDAVSGHSGGVGGDCADLSAGNGCSPLRGMCVEFFVDGDWVEAADVVGVTPTMLTVRLPFDCSEVSSLRVRRLDLDGAEIVSNPHSFCAND